MEQYFSLNGMGIAVLIGDGTLHHFQGGAFSHQTCVCVAKDNDKKLIRLTNWQNDMTMFAWGNTVKGKAKADPQVSQTKRELGLRISSHFGDLSKRCIWMTLLKV